MAYFDQPAAQRRGSTFEDWEMLYWQDWGWVNKAVASDAAITEGTLNISAIDSTVTLPTEISTLGYVGAAMDNDGDTIRTIWYPPPHFNFTKSVDFRVHWTSGSSDTADTVLWKVFVKVHAGDESAALAAPATALDTTIATDNALGTAFVPQQSSWGTFNASNLSHGCILGIEVEMDTKAAGLSEALRFIALQIKFQTTQRSYPNHAR